MTEKTPTEQEPTGQRSRISRLMQPHAGDPDRFSMDRSFAPPLGEHFGKENDHRGFYLDLSSGADLSSWPPPWLRAGDLESHVASIRWGLQSLERYIKGEGDEWRNAALQAAEHLLGVQTVNGAGEGSFHRWRAMPHTYRVDGPWASATAQGKAAGFLARLYAETGEERFALAARRSLMPMTRPVKEGGLLTYVDGHVIYEEYPTRPASAVLNGFMFGLWGFHDVAEIVGDDEARTWWDRGVDSLEALLPRYDTGYWSVYDLYPHAMMNIASPAHHLLHINQLKVMERLAPRPLFTETRQTFEGYRAEPWKARRALAGRTGFRLVSPRNQLLAKTLPWNHRRWGATQGRGDLLVLCYHAVSEDWPADLSTTPGRLEEQLSSLVKAGYRGSTFTDAVCGPRTGKQVVVTFDDAYLSVFELARPILDRLGLPGTVFVPTAYIDKGVLLRWEGVDQWIGGPHESELTPMSWANARELADSGWEIGSHTRTHPRLSKIDRAEVRAELERSRTEVEAGIGRPCVSIAYPYGDYDDGVMKAATAAGYAAGASLPAHHIQRSHLDWPRVGIYNADDQRRFKIKVSRSLRTLRGSSAGPALADLRQRLLARR